MNIEEIKRAVDAGKKVKWASDLYDVVKSQWGEYLIVCRPNGSTIGLHGREGTDRESHLNGDEDQFYVTPSTRHDPRYVDDCDTEGVVLCASWGDLPMGGWTDDDEDAFKDAVIDQLKHDLLPDGSSTLEEIKEGLEIWKLVERETT